jgi:hypothetical protein
LKEREKEGVDDEEGVSSYRKNLRNGEDTGS